MAELVNQFGPWGIVVAGAIFAVKAWMKTNERYIELVERTATALEKVATHLPDISDALKARGEPYR